MPSLLTPMEEAQVAREKAQTVLLQAQAIHELVNAGFTYLSAVRAVRAGDLRKLELV